MANSDCLHFSYVLCIELHHIEGDGARVITCIRMCIPKFAGRGVNQENILISVQGQMGISFLDKMDKAGGRGARSDGLNKGA